MSCVSLACRFFDNDAGRRRADSDGVFFLYFENLYQKREKKNNMAFMKYPKLHYIRIKIK